MAAASTLSSDQLALIAASSAYAAQKNWNKNIDAEVMAPAMVLAFHDEIVLERCTTGKKTGWAGSTLKHLKSSLAYFDKMLFGPYLKYINGKVEAYKKKYVKDKATPAPKILKFILWFDLIYLPSLHSKQSSFGGKLGLTQYGLNLAKLGPFAYVGIAYTGWVGVAALSASDEGKIAAAQSTQLVSSVAAPVAGPFAPLVAIGGQLAAGAIADSIDTKGPSSKWLTPAKPKSDSVENGSAASAEVPGLAIAAAALLLILYK